MKKSIFFMPIQSLSNAESIAAPTAFLTRFDLVLNKL